MPKHTTDYDNYSNDIEVDKYDLDTEAERQSKLYDDWNRLFRQAQQETRQKERALDIATARLRREITKTPDKYGVPSDNKGSVKEGDIKSAIILDSNIQELQDEHWQALYEEKVLKGRVQAFDSRKFLITNLLEMWKEGYYSAPQSPKSRDSAARPRPTPKKRNSPTPRKENS